MSSNSESDDESIDDIAYSDDDNGLPNSHRQPNQHQRYHEVHSDVNHQGGHGPKPYLREPCK